MNSEQTTLAATFSDESKPAYLRVMAGDTLRYLLIRDEKPWAAHCVAQSVIEVATRALTDVEHFDDIYDALHRAYITRGVNDLHCGLIALEWNRPAKERYYQPRMKVMKEFVDAFTAMMVWDRYDRILFSEPPRVGKTTGALFAIAWLIGRNCEDPILAVSYSDKIVNMFHAGLTEIYENPDYRYHDLFPEIQLVNTSAKNLTLDFRDDGKTLTRKYKTITCRSIQGALTGTTEARQLLYLDDLVSGHEEAINIERLISLRDRLVADVYSREKQGCKELYVGTRWSVHDPIGWVEGLYSEDTRTKIIRVPALDPDTDESNFDYPYNVGFNTEHYLNLRDVKYKDDPVTWKCEYQQQPIEREGLLFPIEDLRLGFDVPDISHNPPDDIFAFCDVAFGGNDYLSLPIAYQWGSDVFVVDCVFLKGDYKVTQPLVAGMLRRYGVQRVIFEANNGGDFYANDIRNILKNVNHNILISAQRAASTSTKMGRIVQHSPAIKGFTFLDHRARDERGNYLASEMYRNFMGQLTTFTVDGKNINDDAPDSLAGLAAMMRTNLNATVQVFKRDRI